MIKCLSLKFLANRAFVCTIFSYGLLMLHYYIILGNHDLVPGDLGDARFNNLVLEHNFRFFFTDWPDSYWTAPWIMSPFENSFALSDNLAGASPIYCLFRLWTIDPVSSYQLWLVTCSILNFLSMYWLARTYKLHPIASAVGAFLFAFSMPRGSQITHTQLYPHFFTPLALIALAKHFSQNSRQKKIFYFGLFVLFCVWQIWAGIYLGWFLGVLLVLLLFITLLRKAYRNILWKHLKNYWGSYLFIGGLGLLLLAPLVRPYLSIHSLLGGRTYSDTKYYLPNFISYLLAHSDSVTYSFLKPDLFEGTGSLVNWQEKRMFIGFVGLLAPLSLVIIRYRFPRFFKKSFFEGLFNYAMWSWFLLVLFTFDFGRNISLWPIVFQSMPGADAIRAIARIILTMLIPWSIIVALLIQVFVGSQKLKLKIIGILLAFIVCIENLYTPSYNFSKAHHYDMINRLSRDIREVSQSDECQYFYHSRDWLPFVVHINGMWASITTNIPSLNAYTGIYPKAWDRWDLGDPFPKRQEAVDQWYKTIRPNEPLPKICILD